MILDDGHLRVEVDPDAGGTIASIRHLGTGMEVLARAPWTLLVAPTAEVVDEEAWLARWGGGWPLMFPNGGDACEHGGVRHGFHGEASVAPWEPSWDGDDLVLTRRFAALPARMTRRLSLDRGRLIVEEEVDVSAPCEAIWGQHVTLGGDLLAGQFSIETSATRVMTSADYTPSESPLRPGAEGPWPLVPGRAGPVDLSHPGLGWSTLACLTDFGPNPWVEVACESGTIVRLDWTADPWPLAWLWIETGGESAAPWLGRGRALGVEPCTTWPATGLARAAAAGGHLIFLRPGEPRRGRISLTVT